ncbi:hypothetical membrane protein [Corynebacterium renale]|uniref:DUF3043 domain-containing protein n=1 Tax=Corynebacterium renale TaxID=1724 RepID=UPI000DA35190|nr:DUF3043 domain-containing protein [Corynebacterium renale]SQG65041.1 hypothetical membrane protein [Corynebacterium renale]STC97233.1 hypothetical membrane protein [Corynebacterium renale]
MKNPWKKDEQPAEKTQDSPTSGESVGSHATAQEEKTHLPKGYTPPKGRPTPKRRDVEMAKGVIRGKEPTDPATARQKRKELKESMSKEEWKDYKRKEREETRARRMEMQEAMDRGDERYLLPRDKGPERAFTRDWVDARRMLNNAVMPTAFVLLIIMLIGNAMPQVATIASGIAMIMILLFAIEGFINGRKVNKEVRARFPGTTAAGWGLGFYAYSRSTQPRRWRTPRPRVEIGDSI